MLKNTGQKTNFKKQTRDNRETKHDPEKNNAKHSKTKLPWFSHFLWHSARKRDGLILQQPTRGTTTARTV